MACSALFILDSWYYGQYTFTPVNFLVTNLSPIASFYGRSPWHYYLSQGIPVLCDIQTPLFVMAAWKAFRGNAALKRLLMLIVWTVFVYSLASHKEWRFIHPLLPGMHVITAKYLKDTLDHGYARGWYRGTILVTSVVFPLLLFVQSHAQIAVMYHLRSIPSESLLSVGWLMPCHSTPWQAYLHRPHLNGHFMWALGCEPPLGFVISIYF